MFIRNLCLTIIFICCVVINSAAQNSACSFDKNNLQFSGTPVEQARCLLRPVKPRGILGEQMNKLPDPLEKIIGQKIKIQKDKFRRFLQSNNISEQSLGGSLDDKLSIATMPDNRMMEAMYFIIHDVSAPNYLLQSFPANINDAEWNGNDLARWSNMPVAHVFVNRLGESLAVVGFGAKLPEKKYGTKFARDFLKESAKGLQIHIELVQPRRSDPDWFAGNDAIAPEPGFTEMQYERLALLYIAASIRRGSWLIPAFHCAVDAGIPDAHDDPQNFRLNDFAENLKKLIKIFR